MHNQHPDHDPIANAVKARFTQSFPSMGYRVERRRFGFYQRHQAGLGAVTVTNAEPDDVPALLADVRAYYGFAAVGLYLSEAQAASGLGAAFEAVGCARGAIQVHLAHVGAVPDARPVPDLTTEIVDSAGAEEWTRVKLAGFAGNEAEPEPGLLQSEAALRRAEMAGEGRFMLARIGGEGVAIVGWYEVEQDTAVFLLGTRIAYRGRGIARWLLSDVTSRAYDGGRRSVLIGCDPDDTPIHLYRRLGFRDQVHWRRRYEISASDPWAAARHHLV